MVTEKYPPFILPPFGDQDIRITTSPSLFFFFFAGCDHANLEKRHASDPRGNFSREFLFSPLPSLVGKEAITDPTLSLVPQELKEFLHCCLQKDPSTRSTVDHLLTLPWIKNALDQEVDSAATASNESLMVKVSKSSVILVFFFCASPLFVPSPTLHHRKSSAGEIAKCLKVVKKRNI